jgi:phage recombination protein Bet
MSTEITKIDSIINDPKELSALKQICAKDSTDTEFKLLLEMSKAMNLNPFMKEIYQIKTGRGAQTFVSRDGYRVISQRQKNYDYHFTGAIYSNDMFKVVNGLVHHEYGNAARGELLGAYCVVKKHDSSREVSTVVKLSEFNKGQSNWVSMPEVMITKVAESAALRMAFASQFTGTYHESEEWETTDVKSKQTKHKPQIIDVPDKEPVKVLHEPITEGQLACLMDLIFEKQLSEELRLKAFEHFKVGCLEELSSSQASTMISRLENMPNPGIKARQAEIDKELNAS